MGFFFLNHVVRVGGVNSWEGVKKALFLINGLCVTDFQYSSYI